jgi:organic hydroperoxide reductase OsmC/OhrA
VRATFFNTQKYDVDQEPAYFEQVDIRLSLDSPAPPEQVQALVRHAERDCHAAQSFRQPIPVRLQATLNGTDLAVD